MSSARNGPKLVSTHRAAGLTVASDRELPFPAVQADSSVDLRVRESTYDKLEPSNDAQMIHDIDNRPFPGRFRIFQRDDTIWIDDATWRIRFQAGSGELEFGENPDPEREPQFDLLAERVLIPLYRLLSEDTLVALHGSAVVLDERAWVFVGDSGAGKSTTTRELVRRGARVLADDLTLIDVPAREAIPGAPVIRLIEGLEDVEEALDAQPLFWRHSKHWFRLPDEKGCTQPRPLGGVIWLNSSAANDSFDIARLTGQEAFQRAMAQCFDLSDPEDAWRVRRFKLMAALLRDVPIYEYSYAKSESGEPTHVDPLLRWIESDEGKSRGDSP